MTNTNEKTSCQGSSWLRFSFYTVLVCGVLAVIPTAALAGVSGNCWYRDGGSNLTCFRPAYFRVWENGQIVDEKYGADAQAACKVQRFPDFVTEEFNSGPYSDIIVDVVYSADSEWVDEFDYDPDHPYYDGSMFGFDPFGMWQNASDISNQYEDGASNWQNHIRWWAARWGGGPGYSGAVECDYKSLFWWGR